MRSYHTTGSTLARSYPAELELTSLTLLRHFSDLGEDNFSFCTSM